MSDQLLEVTDSFTYKGVVRKLEEMYPMSFFGNDLVGLKGHLRPHIPPKKVIADGLYDLEELNLDKVNKAVLVDILADNFKVTAEDGKTNKQLIQQIKELHAASKEKGE